MKIRSPEIRVEIAVEAWQRLEHWISLAGDYEVSGLGIVEQRRSDDGLTTRFLVTNVFLPKQTNGPASTELDPESVARAMLGLAQAGNDTCGLRFWWHLHPGPIGLFWSVTDEDCVQSLQNGDWIVSSVFQPDMSVRTRVDVYRPVRVVIDQVPTRIAYPDLGLFEECKTRFNESVKRAAAPSVFKDLVSGKRLAKDALLRNTAVDLPGATRDDADFEEPFGHGTLLSPGHRVHADRSIEDGDDSCPDCGGEWRDPDDRCPTCGLTVDDLVAASQFMRTRPRR